LSFCIYFFYNKTEISNTQFVLQIISLLLIIASIVFAKNRNQRK